MSHFLLYLSMRRWEIGNAIAQQTKKPVKSIVVPGFFLAIALFIFVVLYKAFVFFQTFDLFGEILIMKLLALIFFIFFLFLILSNVNSIVKWFLTKEDLPFLLTSPVSSTTIFFARSLEALIESSWAFLFFSAPVLLAYYAALFRFKPLFLLSLLLLIPYALIPYGLAFLLVIILSRFVSPSIIRRTFSFLLILLAGALVVTLRAMEIEKFARPETFAYLYDYMKYLSLPAHPLLPIYPFIETVVFLAKGQNPQLGVDLGYFLSTALALGALSYCACEAFYFDCYRNVWKGQRTVKGDLLSRLFFFLPSRTRNFFLKEIKSLQRDPKEWSQVLLVFALIFVYVYNFKSFPRDRTMLPTVFLESLLSYLNMGLLTFVIAAISVRFIYPTFQLEGRPFWLILTAPIDVRELYNRKLAFYVPVILTLSLTLNLLSNLYISPPAFLHYLSFGYVALVSLTSPVICLYFGIKHLNLKEPPNPYGGFGGIVSMLIIFAYTVLSLGLLGWSSYPVLLRHLSGTAIPPLLIVRFSIVCSVLLVVTIGGLYMMRVRTIEMLRKVEM